MDLAGQYKVSLVHWLSGNQRMCLSHVIPVLVSVLGEREASLCPTDPPTQGRSPPALPVPSSADVPLAVSLPGSHADSPNTPKVTASRGSSLPLPSVSKSHQTR